MNAITQLLLDPPGGDDADELLDRGLRDKRCDFFLVERLHDFNGGRCVLRNCADRRVIRLGLSGFKADGVRHVGILLTRAEAPTELPSDASAHQWFNREQRPLSQLGEHIMKVIKNYPTSIDAELAKLKLDAAGIFSTVVGVEVSMEGGASGVQLLVPDDSVEAALSALERSSSDDVAISPFGAFETLTVWKEAAVVFVEISAAPMNLLGPELVRDLVSLIQRTEADDAAQVLVFKSADPDYFIPHVDLTRIKEYRAEAAKLTGDASLALLFRHLSASRLVTIAQIEGRVRGAGSEFVLACDMRFAARETAIFGQPEAGFGVIPGAGGIQHLVRLMGRSRALEVILSAEDYDAGLAERYGWINRALPADELSSFVTALAHRIAKFPAAGLAMVKDRVNAISLAPGDDFRRDSDLFGDGVRNPEAQRRIQAAMKRGFQTRGAELGLARMLGELADH
jgi:enoyl-CoA hydratase/carnithine racemase